MDQGERVLAGGVVIDRDIHLAVELLERIEEIESVVPGRPAKALRRGICVEVSRLHVHDPRRRFELRLAQALLEAAARDGEVEEPGLRFAFARMLGGEVAAQCDGILSHNARHKTRAAGQRNIFKNLLSFRDGNDLFHRQRLEVHDGHRRVDLRPARAFARPHVVHLGHDVGALADADKLRIVRALHLRRGDLDEPRQHFIRRGFRIPTWREQRRMTALIVR